jgi:hypothetical protein
MQATNYILHLFVDGKFSKEEVALSKKERSEIIRNWITELYVSGILFWIDVK